MVFQYHALLETYFKIIFVMLARESVVAAFGIYSSASGYTAIPPQSERVFIVALISAVILWVFISFRVTKKLFRCSCSFIKQPIRKIKQFQKSKSRLVEYIPLE